MQDHIHFLACMLVLHAITVTEHRISYISTTFKILIDSGLCSSFSDFYDIWNMNSRHITCPNKVKVTVTGCLKVLIFIVYDTEYTSTNISFEEFQQLLELDEHDRKYVLSI